MNKLFKTMTAHGDVAANKNEDAANMPSASSHDRIFIRSLHIPMKIGVTDEERANKQEVIVNVVMEVSRNPSWQNDEITDVISYADVQAGIERIAAQKPYKLLETFVEIIADYCLSYDRALSASIRAEKPEIFKQTDSVGVEIFRAKNI